MPFRAHFLLAYMYICHMSTLSKILVIIQFSCLAFLVLYTKIRGTGFILALQFIGISISIWSVFVMRIGRFNIQPEVKTEAKLITKGPYSLIRNPMYSGLLLVFGAGLFDSFQLIEVSVYVILTAVLLFKIKLEEKYLLLKFGERYSDYKKTSFRLLPYIY